MTGFFGGRDGYCRKAEKEQEYEEKTTIALENTIKKGDVDGPAAFSEIQLADIHLRTWKTHIYERALMDQVEL